MNQKKNYIVAILLTLVLTWSNLGQVFAVTTNYSNGVTYTGQEVYNILKNKYGWEVVNSTALYCAGFSFHNLKGANGYDMKIGTTPSDGWGLDWTIAVATNSSESEASNLVNRYMVEKDKPENFNKTKYTYKLNGRKIIFSQDEYDYVTTYESLAVYIGPKIKDDVNVFSKFEVNSVDCESTSIIGKGLKGAIVKAYVDRKQIGKTAIVDLKGAYKISISKQKAGKKVVVKMSKSGYATTEKSVTVLNVFKIFTVNSVKNTSTNISGKGLKGASVKAYVDGKQIGKIAEVDSKGAYKISIPKQKEGKKVVVKMSKSGYTTIKKLVTVKK